MEAAVFNQFSDQVVRIEEHPDHFLWHIDRCPVCWGRKTDKPVCFAATGLLQESLRWLSGGREFRIDETTCIGMGDPSCTFMVYKEPVG
jgi:predicted hydrocarbon binding protein